MTTINKAEYISGISFTFNNVDKMADKQFKECIVKMFLAKYPDANSMTINCNKLFNCSDGQEVEMHSTVRY